MPKFFYHITDGDRTFSDANGVELKNIEEARRHLVSYIYELKSFLYEKKIYEWADWAVVLKNNKDETIEITPFNLVPRI